MGATSVVMMWWWLAVGMNFLMLQLVVATILWLTAGAARLVALPLHSAQGPGPGFQRPVHAAGARIAG